MRVVIITLAVALFLGLAKPQLVVTPPPTQQQEAIQSITAIPKFATPAAQSAIGQKMATDFGITGGASITGSGAYAFSPEAYLNQVTGGPGAAVSAPNSFMKSQMDLQKQWVGTQADLAKTQMMLFYTEEMVLLQTELQATADSLSTACDWACVTDCAKVKLDLVSKVDCMETCRCF